MNDHIAEEVLRSFVEGEIDEQPAVAIALHLDDCPTCAARAEALDPLAEAFASMTDPGVPRDLVASVLEEAARPEAMPVVEIGVGAGLLAAAVLVAFVLGDPVATAVQLGVLVDALSTASAKLSLVTNASLFALSLTTVAVGTLSLAAARFAFAEGRPS